MGCDTYPRYHLPEPNFVSSNLFTEKGLPCPAYPSQRADPSVVVLKGLLHIRARIHCGCGVPYATDVHAAVAENNTTDVEPNQTSP